MRQRFLRDWPLLMTVVIVLYAFWAWLVPEAISRRAIGMVLAVAAGAVAGLSIVKDLPRMEAQGTERSWRFLAVALTLWALSDGFEAVHLLVYSTPPPLPSLADLLRLSGYLAALSALATFPLTPPERFGRVRDLLDVLIITFSAAAFSWFLFIRPVIDVGLSGGIRIFWTSVAPVFDLVLLLLSLRLALLSRFPKEGRAFWLMSLAGLVLCMSDLSHGYRTLQREPFGSGMIEAGWIAAAVLVGMASRFGAASGRAGSPFQESPDRRWSERLEPILPIALTYLVVGVTLLDWRISAEVDWLGVAAAATLSLLLVARQGVIAGQFEMRQYAALVNTAADLAFICEQDGEIRLANPALRQALGVTKSRKEPWNLADFMISDQELSHLLQEALERGWNGEVSLRRNDGDTFPVKLSLRPVRDQSLSQALLAATAHDLTAIRARERELRSALDRVASARRELEALNAELEQKVADRTSELQATIADLARLNEELKELDRLKTEFVALVSHELRAPLTNIHTGVELLLEGYPGLDGEVKEALSLVQAETRQLIRLVETILNLSALEAGHLSLGSESLSLKQVACSASRRLSPEEMGERIRLGLPEELPPVLADEWALESVFYHLLDNALKYAHEGEIYLEGWSNDSHVYVAVSDRGPGIPAAERERVFELFHRLDSSDAREVYGHGLGLPMVQRLLQAMEGGIRVEDAPIGGARFCFWLPRADKAGS